MKNIASFSNWQLPLSNVRHWKKASCLLGFIFLVNNLTFTQRFLNRELSYNKAWQRTGEETFQITLTGVPNRVPTNTEYHFLEGVLFKYLDTTLTSQGVETSSIIAKADKTIHYKRSLNKQFTVVGDQFASNGDLQIDQETMIRINETNRKVLSLGDDNSVHQISLLIAIRGMYHSPTDIDYGSLIMKTLNDGQMKLVHSLTNPTSKDSQAARYYENLKFLVCIGTGPRDSDPILEMASAKSSSGESRTAGNSLENRYRSWARSKDEQDNSNTEPTYDVDRQSDQLSYDADTVSRQGDKPINDFNTKNTPDFRNSTFNAEAMEFRLVSGVILMVLCVLTALWNIARIAAKKNEERKRRLKVAKTAYEGPRKDKKPGKTFFNSSKYTGTMDTGTGLQELA